MSVARRTLAVMLLLLGGGFSSVAQGDGGLRLADGGKSTFRIVVGATASPSERHAAAELQHFMKEISGAQLLIADGGTEMQPHEILIGDSKHLRQLGLQIDWDALGDEGFVMRTHGGHLVLAGGKQRGSLYAVYTFLEEVLGCRWFAPDVSRIPSMSRIVIEALSTRHVPRFEYRAVGWSPSADPDWSARNRVNAGTSLSEERGGHVTMRGGGHSFFSLLPPGRYFEDHPEYYSEINGRRTHHKAQLCLTNPEVVRLAAEGVKKWMRDGPDSTLVGVGQGDWGGWCECASCSAISKREESQSGPLIGFLNQVGEIVERDFPDVSIISLAYQHTRKPPKTIRPRRNVIPWVCGIECCYSHPIDRCERNRSFKADIESWANLTDRFYVWDYTANFEHYVMPQPNLRVFKPNYELFVKNHVRGIYASGNTGKGSELAELRGYLLAKLLWNPERDQRAVVAEFLDGYYGKAADAMDRYIQLMHDKVERDDIHCTIVASPRMPHLAPDMIAQAKTLFDEAERRAENETIRERVRVARLPIQHVELEWSKPPYRFEDGVYKADLVSGMEALAKEFAEVAKRNGNPRICGFEGRTPAWHVEQQAFWKKTWPAVRLENEHLRVDVVPGLGGRIISLYHKGKERELLLPPQPDGREYPWSGGYEEYSQRGGRSDGWHDTYEYREEVPRRRVLMWSTLSNGLKMERTLELSETDDLLTIRSGIVNISSEAKMACLRAHPKLQLGPTEQVVVSFTTVAGGSRSVRLRTEPGESRAKLRLEGKGRPDGVWEAANHRLGLAIRQHFHPGEVAECLVDWLPARERFFLELSSPEDTLAPGESIRMTHRYEILESS